MSRHVFKFVNNLRIRWKMTVVVLPLVLVPIIVVGTVVGWIAYQQAYLGITQTSKDDLDHLAAFTVDLLDAHNQQFLTYQEDRKGATENLNAPGMSFEPLAFAEACNTPDPQLAEDACPNRFYAYGVIGRLALLAAAKEITESHQE